MDAGFLSPSPEGLRANASIAGFSHEMAPRPEMTADHRVGRQEPLCLAGRFEPLRVPADAPMPFRKEWRRLITEHGAPNRRLYETAVLAILHDKLCSGDDGCSEMNWKVSNIADATSRCRRSRRPSRLRRAFADVIETMMPRVRFTELLHEVNRVLAAARIRG